MFSSHCVRMVLNAGGGRKFEKGLLNTRYKVKDLLEICWRKFKSVCR